MIGVDPVSLDVGQVVWRKQGLVRYDLGRVLERMGPAGISGEASVPEPECQFGAVILAFCVVERREGVGLAELPVVKQVPRPLVIDAGANFEGWTICGRDRRLGGH